MVDDVTGIREGEVAAALPDRFDAQVYFIGRIRTPWPDRDGCPKRGDAEGPMCRIEVFAPWVEALEGIEAHPRLQVLYWMHLARRDLLLQRPRSSRSAHGTFAIRSPVRANPIAVSQVEFVAREGATLLVRGLDCVDGTPLIDIKPEACPASGQTG
jgi:tRNA-Thr(GGU) m(6)t(6)A37 methyltransferase TsaA